MIFNKRKANRELGSETAKLLFLIMADKRPIGTIRNAAQLKNLKERGLVTVDSPAPGWQLYAYAETDAILEAGYASRTKEEQASWDAYREAQERIFAAQRAASDVRELTNA